MEVTLEWIKLGLSILNFIGLIVGAFYVRLERKDTATTKSIDELRAYADKRFDDKCSRISKLEIEVGRIPTRDEFDRAQRRMEEYIKGVYDRINEIEKSNRERTDKLSETTQHTVMLVHEAVGQLKQINERLKHE